MLEIKISQKNLTIWRIYLIIPTFVCAFLTSFFFRMFSFWWLVLTAVWLILFLFFYTVYFPLRLKKLSLTIDNDTVTLKSGVFYNIIRVVKKDKIQFVKEIKTPLLYIFKVKSFVVCSAGGKIYTPCIDEDDVKGDLNVPF